MNPERYAEWKQWSATDFGVCSPEDGAYFAAELRRAGVDLIAGLRIVEIGFGNGGFAAWAIAHDVVYRGTEIIPELLQRAREKGIVVFDGAAPLDAVVARESVDVVVGFDVFEHLALPALVSLLGSARVILRRGGRLIARVPSGDSPFARSVQYGDLTHRLTLGSSAVCQLAAATGFRIVQLRPPVFPLGGKGPSGWLRRGLVACGRAVAYPIIERLFMGGGSHVLSPNMLAVLEKPTSDGEQIERAGARHP